MWWEYVEFECEKVYPRALTVTNKHNPHLFSIIPCSFFDEWHTYLYILFWFCQFFLVRLVFFMRNAFDWKIVRVLAICWRLAWISVCHAESNAPIYDYDILIHLVWCFLGAFFINFPLYLRRDWCSCFSNSKKISHIHKITVCIMHAHLANSVNGFFSSGFRLQTGELTT